MKVIIVSGPTASGKTNLSIELAKKFNGEIVNFDSLLFYHEINIGTAKPSDKELSAVPHHLINIRSIKDPLNASDFISYAHPQIQDILSRNKIAFLVGGSGFYLQALLKGMYDSPTTPLKVMTKSKDLYNSQGIQPFLEILRNHDPESALKYHPNDHYRIMRAVEHWWTHGTPFSMLKELKEKSLNLQNGNIHGWNMIHLYLNIPKYEHLKIIEKRSKEMVSSGLVSEVKDLIERGFSTNLKPLQSIGYKESIDYINGVTKSLDELVEKIIISTRQLAKAQRTWFNRDKSKIEFNPLLEIENIYKRIESFL